MTHQTLRASSDAGFHDGATLTLHPPTKKKLFCHGSNDMNIKDICIGDSRINEYKLEDQTLTMILQDYNETSYEIIMTHCSHISVKGSVGFSLSEGKFTRTETGNHWYFYDADGAVLELRFRDYLLRKIDKQEALV